MAISLGVAVAPWGLAAADFSAEPSASTGVDCVHAAIARAAKPPTIATRNLGRNPNMVLSFWRAASPRWKAQDRRGWMRAASVRRAGRQWLNAGLRRPWEEVSGGSPRTRGSAAPASAQCGPDAWIDGFGVWFSLRRVPCATEP